jgi:uncharacterized repeat protein (TIGR03803 family)
MDPNRTSQFWRRVRDGAYPNALVVGANGIIYGTTGGGGPNNQGTVFSLTAPTSAGAAWTETVLYFFSGGSDGGSPAGLAMDSNGVIYGTTTAGGISNCGTVFSLTL